ncbi:hypothetical protein [Streptacidiphilus pinicola]|uniref:hypothetical protein n=1 Tax=Streptacidiphilus pinicola TaxID=2219663 RepID=UPI001402DF87|nr:hypothetical protein [Streptacidiphilus pinicola]
MGKRTDPARVVRLAGQRSLGFLLDEGWAGPVEIPGGLEYLGPALSVRLTVDDGPTLTLGTPAPDGPRATLAAVWNACGLPAPVPRPRVDELTDALRAVLPLVQGPGRDAVLRDAARGLRRLSPRAPGGVQGPAPLTRTTEHPGGPDASRPRRSPSG